MDVEDVGSTIGPATTYRPYTTTTSRTGGAAPTGQRIRPIIFPISQPSHPSRSLVGDDYEEEDTTSGSDCDLIPSASAGQFATSTSSREASPVPSPTAAAPKRRRVHRALPSEDPSPWDVQAWAQHCQDEDNLRIGLGVSAWAQAASSSSSGSKSHGSAVAVSDDEKYGSEEPQAVDLRFLAPYWKSLEDEHRASSSRVPYSTFLVRAPTSRVEGGHQLPPQAPIVGPGARNHHNPARPLPRTPPKTKKTQGTAPKKRGRPSKRVVVDECEEAPYDEEEPEEELEPWATPVQFKTDGERKAVIRNYLERLVDGMSATRVWAETPSLREPLERALHTLGTACGDNYQDLYRRLLEKFADQPHSLGNAVQERMEQRIAQVDQRWQLFDSESEPTPDTMETSFNLIVQRAIEDGMPDEVHMLLRLDHHGHANVFVNRERANYIVTNKKSGEGYVWSETERVFVHSDAILGDIQSEIPKVIGYVVQEYLALFSALYFFQTKHHQITYQLEQKLQKLVQVQKKCYTAPNAQKVSSFLKKRLYQGDFEKKLDGQQHLFSLAGGKVINLKTGVCRDKTREDYCSDRFQSPVHWNPNADQTVIKQLMQDWFLDRKDTIGFMQQWYGYCMTGEQKEKKFLILHGPHGNNAKSTLVDALSQLFGTYHVELDREVLFDNGARPRPGAPTPHLARLEHKRFATHSECRESDVLYQNGIKIFTGGDWFTVREVHGRKIKQLMAEFKPNIPTNELPQFRLGPLTDRLIIVEVPVEFVDEPTKDYQKKKDPHIRELLKTQECQEALLQYCVEGARQYYALGGLAIPAEVQAYTKAQLQQRDTVMEFFDAWYDMNRHADDDFSERSSHLHMAYKTYCKENELGAQALGKHQFFFDVAKKKNFPKKKRSDGHEYFLGLKRKLIAGAAAHFRDPAAVV